MQLELKNKVQQSLACGATVCLVSCLAFTAVLVEGCGKSSAKAIQPPPGNQPKLLDDSAVVRAFSAAPPAVQYTVMQPVNEAEAGGYSDALRALQNIAADSRLTPDEKSAVDGFIQEIKTQMTSGK